MGSCFDPPEFPDTPHINFRDIGFKPGGGLVNDSLIVTIEFEDGDGDLGIDGAAPEFKSGSFSNVFLYQTNESDKAHPIELSTDLHAIDHIKVIDGKEQRVTTTLNILQIANPTTGKLIFPRTRKQSGYSYLPEYNCEFYEDLARSTTYAIEAKNKAVLDPTAVVDTLYARINATKVATHYVLQDTVYVTRNPNHYNIEVDFLIKDPANPMADGDGFVEYNWNREQCQQNLDGRFPILTDDSGGPLAGTIRYGMISRGFRVTFTIKTLKLRIKIRDRAFNESNEITTGEFTLDSIRIP
jgi:hypothetical protein